MGTIRQTTVTTRKNHDCAACGVRYPAGTVMEYSVTTDGRDLVCAYWCLVCQEFMKSLHPWDLDFGFNADIWEFDGYAEFRSKMRPAP